MNFKEFKQIIDKMIVHNKQVDKAYALNIDLIEFCEKQNEVVHLLWNHILTTEGLDWLNWFMYEKNYIYDGKGRSEMTAEDSDGTPICRTLKELYDYINTNKYFKS